MKNENQQQSEKFTGIVNPDKQNSTSEELIKRTPVKETPFTIITMDGKHFGMFGQYKITEDYLTLEECEKALSPITWNRVIQLTAIVSNILNNK